jgi:hypothetical protein
VLGWRDSVSLARDLGRSRSPMAYVRALPRMRKVIAKYQPPYFAKVYRNGIVKVVANWGGPHAARP